MLAEFLLNHMNGELLFSDYLENGFDENIQSMTTFLLSISPIFTKV